MLLQQRGGADARELEQLRRIDRTGAQDHFLECGGGDHFVAVPDLHAGAALAAIGLGLDDEFGGLRVGPQFEIRAAVAGRTQKRLGGVPAPAVLLIHLEVAHAFVVTAIEVVGGRYAGLLRRLREGIENVPAQALLFHAPLAPAAGALVAVQLLEGLAGLGGIVEFPMVFVAAKGRQHVVPAPLIVAGDLRPLVIVPRLAAHVDHAVDARTTAQRLAARIAQRATVQARIGFGVVQPIRARVADAIQIADGDVDPVIVIPAARLDEQGAQLLGPGEPVGEQRSRCAAADDDVFESILVVAHGCRVLDDVQTDRLTHAPYRVMLSGD